ncbi:AraC family transcriptional regulator [Pedobacter sp. HDW13]|uniref:GyrI-like domain-containing protein n=1 Tax=unclassified Pedobacter TaxID=2628915 RepID=UPI000F5992BD|nr:MULTISPECIES: GyrI-like domain-containing protein [unclassified Pedobacter]QIL37844.1 AraC family transcriptional regulator [Pedobacter sp. HDW13]RQO79005.1 AraC family transcriptional regulator [Pedobacter sp. KBW01]
MEKIEIKPFKVIGIAVRTTNENNQAIKDIGALWDRFLKDGIHQAIPNKTDDTIYSIYTDYESDHTRPYTTILGCQVGTLDNIPQGMTGKLIDGGKYVKLSAVGNLSNGVVGDKWAEIWSMDLKRVFTSDFEVYGEKAKNPNQAEIDFFIAVK